MMQFSKLCMPERRDHFILMHLIVFYKLNDVTFLIDRRHGIVAFNTELDAVVESIYGNRKDQVCSNESPRFTKVPTLSCGGNREAIFSKLQWGSE